MQTRISKPDALETRENEELLKAEEDATHWTQQLELSNRSLLLEKNLQKIAYNKILGIEDELKKLNTENPNNTLKIQEKALNMALKSLAETKNKTVIGAIEMIAISVSLCAVTMATMKFAFSDLFLALTTFKISAMTMISSVVGTSGYFGWSVDKKASLNTRMATDNVQASKTAVNKCNIHCKERAKLLQVKTAEKKAAYRAFENANMRVQAATEAVLIAELKLNQANKIMNTTKTFSNNTHMTFSKSACLRQSLEKLDTPTIDKKSINDEKQFSTPTPM